MPFLSLVLFTHWKLLNLMTISSLSTNDFLWTKQSINGKYSWKSGLPTKNN